MVEAGPFITRDNFCAYSLRPVQLRSTGLQTGRLIPIEVWIVPSKEQTLQPVYLIKDSAGHSFSLQPKLLCQTVYGVNNLSMYQVIVAGNVNVAPCCVCERKKRLCRILPRRSSKCGLESTPMIYNRRCESILFGVAHPNVPSVCHDVAATYGAWSACTELSILHKADEMAWGREGPASPPSWVRSRTEPSFYLRVSRQSAGSAVTSRLSLTVLVE
jgi:hypothetical protein